MSADSKVACPICNQLFAVEVIERHCESCLDVQQIQIDEQLAASLSRAESSSLPPNASLPSETRDTRENENTGVIPPHLSSSTLSPHQNYPQNSSPNYSPQPVYSPSPSSYPNHSPHPPQHPHHFQAPHQAFPQPNGGYYSQQPANPHYVPANAANTPPVYLTFQQPPTSPNMSLQHPHPPGSQITPTYYPNHSPNPQHNVTYNPPNTTGYPGNVSYPHSNPYPSNQPNSFYGRPESSNQPSNYYSQPPVSNNGAVGYPGKSYISPIPAPPPRNQQDPHQNFTQHYSNYARLAQQIQLIQNPTNFIQQEIRDRSAEMSTETVREGWLWCAFHKPDASSYVRRWVLLNKERLYVFTDGDKKVESNDVRELTAIDLSGGILSLRFKTGVPMFFTDGTSTSTKDWMQSIKIVNAMLVSEARAKPEPKLVRDQPPMLSPKTDKKPSFVDIGISFMNRVTNTMAPEELKRLDEQWVKALQEHPEEEKALVTGHLTVILTQASNHKFGKVLNNFSDTWLKNARRLLKKRETIQHEEFDKICGEVKAFTDGLISALAGNYKELSEVSEQTFECCRETIEDLLFPKIYKELFELFKYRYIEDEVSHSKKMKEFLIVNFAHLGIPPLFWLTPSGDEETSMQIPYHKAISTLQQLSSLISPNKKIDCLQEAAKAIVSCVSDFYKDNKEVNSSKILVGGDEFLPLFTYVLIRANVPNTYTESMFMDFFISNKRVMEKGGYLVATMQTALSFILCLSQSQMEKSASEILTQAAQQEQSKLEKEEKEKPAVIVAAPTMENKNPFITLEDLESSLPKASGSDDDSATSSRKSSISESPPTLPAHQQKPVSLNSVDLIDFE